MERFVDIRLKSQSIPKHYYSEKSYVKCPDCPKLLHCSYCVRHLRTQNPHHWVGVTVNEVPGCRGCQERYHRGIAEARHEANGLTKKLNILESRLAAHSEGLKEAQEVADVKLAAQQLAFEGAESVVQMDLRAQIEDLSKTNEDAESIMGMKLRLELERMKEALEEAENRVTFLKRRPPADTMRGAGLGSTLPPLGDVTLVVQGQNIYAHQLTLGCKSRVFQKLFEEQLQQLRQKMLSETPKHWVEIAPTLPRPVEIPPAEPAPRRPVERAPTLPPPRPVEVAPTLSPPRPDPPPTFSLRPAESPPTLRKRAERINPVVSVRLTPSAMLEQMGLRGIRCQFSVSPAQLLVDNSTQLDQDSSEMNSKQFNEGKMHNVKTVVTDSAPADLKVAGASFTEHTVPPLVNHSDRHQAITPQTSHPVASGLTSDTVTPPTTVPGSVSVWSIQDLKKNEKKSSEEFVTKEVTIPSVIEQARSTGNSEALTNSLTPSRSPPQNLHPFASGLALDMATPPITVPNTLSILPLLPVQDRKQNEKKFSEDGVTEELTMVTIPLMGEQARPRAKSKVLIETSLPPSRSPGVQSILQVHDTSYAVMRAVISCCYTADMQFTEEVSPEEVLKVAHKFEINYLRDLCEQELCKRLNAGNVAEMLKLGCKFAAKKLHLQATQFFKENFDEVQESVLNSYSNNCQYP